MKSELNTLRNHTVGFKIRNGAPETGDCTCGCTNTKTKCDWYPPHFRQDFSRINSF